MTREELAGWLQALSWLSPATYVLNGVRATLLDGAVTRTLWPTLWPLLLIGTLAIPAGMRVFHLAERYAKRAGKLARNG